MKLRTILAGILVLGSFPIAATAASREADKFEPVRLACEYRENPLGIDVQKPRLFWWLADRKQETGSGHREISSYGSEIPRGVQQTAYQILVASSEELLNKDQGDLWESGRVESNQSIQVEYSGKPLGSFQYCYWKVRVWTKTNSEPGTLNSVCGPWSKPAFWVTGLLKPDDWQAKWIKFPANETSPWMRKEFSIDAAPGRAMAFVNVKGYYELYVNGKKVDDDVLSPAVSDFSKRTFYRAHDISRFLRPGKNCIGVWLGTGWARSGMSARVQLNMTIGGRDEVIGTDKTWTFSPSSYTLLGGWKWADYGVESLDANRDIPDWSEAGCKTGKWMPVEECRAPAGVVVAQTCEPNRIGRTIPLVKCTALGKNIWELDFGVNLTGWLKIRMPKLAQGTRISWLYADRRYQSIEGDKTPAGNIRATRAFRVKADGGDIAYQYFNQKDEFISAGKEGEQFCSKFSYHGFRYVILYDFPVQPTQDDVEALPIASDLGAAGSFECSNDLLNRIYQVNLWTLRCLSLGGYMVDCPHRERLGYGDGQVGFDSMVMSRNAPAFYAKWANDWLDGQNPSTGELPYTAPRMGGGGGPAWGGTGCVLPFKLNLYYGDRRLLENAYEPMRRYVELLESRCTNDILRAYGGKWDFIGDWVAPGRGMDTSHWPEKSAAELFNNCYRVYLMELLVKSAEILGKTDEVQHWNARLREIRPLIHTAFYDAPNKQYVIDEESYQVMPLMTGVTPDAAKEAVTKRLEELITVKNNGHLDTGMLGTYFLLDYLQEIGRNDLLYTIMNQTTYPGWGYMISQGATTFWEQWNGYYSHIHSCFTSPGGWLQQGVAGIRADPDGPGFKKIIIKPSLVGDLKWAKGSYDSIHGRIVSNWTLENGKLQMDVTIPENTSATIHVPARSRESVTESGVPAGKGGGLRFLGMEKGCAVYEAGSGCYLFGSKI